MIDESAIRELLIDSCHSSAAADNFFRCHLDDTELLALLVQIVRDADDYQGDAPMQAAYWMSQFRGDLLMLHEASLLEMLPIVDGYGGHVALALGKTRSPRGRQAIVRELGNGERFDAWLYQQGIEAADDEV